MKKLATSNSKMKGILNLEYAHMREKKAAHKYRIQRRTHEVLNAINKFYPNPNIILDLGTAEGKMLYEIKKKHINSHCIGIDYSWELINYGAKKFSNVHFVHADVQNLSFLKEETIDIIIATAVIEHLAFPQSMLQESFRILKKKGIIILTSPHPFWEKISNLLGLINGEHQNVMNPKKILFLFRKYKFSILEHRGFMIAPSGIKGEIKIENLLSKLHVDNYLPNQLFVAKK